jgi:AraC-like DNA-binding protein
MAVHPFQFQSYVPSASLRGLVRGIWTGDGQVPFVRECIVPDGSGILLVNLGSDVSTSLINGQGAALLGRGVYYAGIQTFAAHMQYVPLQRYRQVGVLFAPGQSNLFLGKGMDRFANVIVSLDQDPNLRPYGNKLLHELHSKHDNASVFHCLEEWLCCMLQRHSLLLTNGLLRRYGAQEFPSAKYLKEASGFSHQYLNRLLLDEIGVTLKQYERIERFQKAWQLLSLYPQSLRLLDAAVDAGYYDQAHFNHEFRTITGRSPSDFYPYLAVSPGRVVRF